jgi:crotonobetainyl-CoA:carnitine CoA-transferase CaiB-like acyl-CoA transferase
MAQAVGAAAIWKERNGAGQSLSIDIRQAAHGINPELTFHPTINGHPYPNWLGNMHPFTVFPYRTKDGRWVYPSGVYPHQHFAWSNFFNCGVSHANIAAAIAKWDAAELEDTANAKGHTLCIARSPEEWLAHLQGSYLANEPVIAVRKIGDRPPVPFAPAKRPLEGIRVLSLTHAIAGPVVGRTLAEQGADVLCVNRTNDSEHDWVYDDANVGQRSTFLDLNDPQQNKICKDLARTTDIYIDSYCGRKMVKFGFSPEELASLRPGIIVVNVRCYGWGRPWFDRGVLTCWGPPLPVSLCSKARPACRRCHRPRSSTITSRATWARRAPPRPC